MCSLSAATTTSISPNGGLSGIFGATKEWKQSPAVAPCYVGSLAQSLLGCHSGFCITKCRRSIAFKQLYVNTGLTNIYTIFHEYRCFQRMHSVANRGFFRRFFFLHFAIFPNHDHRIVVQILKLGMVNQIQSPRLVHVHQKYRKRRFDIWFPFLNGLTHNVAIERRAGDAP